jgi:hypothetical protein
MAEEHEITRRVMIGSATVAGIGVLVSSVQAAGAAGPPPATRDKDRQFGIVGKVPASSDSLVYEVKSYVVQVNFTASTTTLPSAYSIYFASEKNAGGGGRIWFNRTASDAAAISAMLDKAFAANQKVYYSYQCEQLSIGMAPQCFDK